MRGAGSVGRGRATRSTLEEVALKGLGLAQVSVYETPIPTTAVRHLCV